MYYRPLEQLFPGDYWQLLWLLHCSDLLGMEMVKDAGKGEPLLCRGFSFLNAEIRARPLLFILNILHNLCNHT